MNEQKKRNLELKIKMSPLLVHTSHHTPLCGFFCTSWPSKLQSSKFLFFSTVWWWMDFFRLGCCKAQLQFSQTEFSLNPDYYTHPRGKYISGTSSLPRKLKLGMEVLVNQTRSTSLLAWHQLISQKCRGYQYIILFWLYLSHFSDFNCVKKSWLHFKLDLDRMEIKVGLWFTQFIILN